MSALNSIIVLKNNRMHITPMSFSFEGNTCLCLSSSLNQGRCCYVNLKRDKWTFRFHLNTSTGRLSRYLVVLSHNRIFMRFYNEVVSMYGLPSYICFSIRSNTMLNRNPKQMMLKNVKELLALKIFNCLLIKYLFEIIVWLSLYRTRCSFMDKVGREF